MVSSAYLLSISDHADECEQDLQELQKRLTEGHWSRFDELAAERSLQVLIEAAIGIAKHWAKETTGQTQHEALASFNCLAEQGLIGSSIPWKKMIGLRNALVHDYLVVDVEIVQSVISQEYYRQPLCFIRSAVSALR